MLQFVNLNTFRTKFILGFSIFMGLSIPQYFNEYTLINNYGPVHTRARWVLKKLSLDKFPTPKEKKNTDFYLLLLSTKRSIFLFHFLQFNDMINVPFSSEPFVAGLLAMFMDVTLYKKKDNTMRKDRGQHWWDKFRAFKTDSRSEEFYSLPFNLNKYFPSV